MDDHVSRILQLLQDGKITAPEAATLIDALGDKAKAGGSARANEKATCEVLHEMRPFFNGLLWLGFLSLFFGRR